MSLVFLVIFWVLVLVVLLGREALALSVFFASTAFGSFAVVPTEALGGLTILATPVLALALSARILSSPGGMGFMARNALNLRSLGLMSLFWATAVVVTFFGPRLFTGVDIIPVRGLVSRVADLQPTTQNLSQIAYLTTSVFFCFAVARLLSLPGRGVVVLSALCMAGLVTIATGLLDLANQAVDLSFLLTPLRSASYSLMVDNEILGTKRLVGLMPEASAFGGICVSQAVMLHFLAILDTPGQGSSRNWALKLRPVIVFLLVGLAMLSTSSAAYVGLAIFACAACLNWALDLFRLTARHERQSRTVAGDISTQAVTGAALFMVGCVVLLLSPESLTPAVQMVDRMVFQKGASASFAEREFWTRVSWDALWATHGFGVGVGSTRASNSVVAVFSNTGLLGGVLLYGLVAQKFLMSPPADQVFARDLHRRACWPYLIGLPVGLMIGTSPDFGTGGAFVIALLALPSLVHRDAQPKRSARGRPVIQRTPSGGKETTGLSHGVVRRTIIDQGGVEHGQA